MKWPPDFMKQPFYSLEDSFVHMEMVELFDGYQARDEHFHLALGVVRENNHNPYRIELPDIHKKAWGVRYTFADGIADHILVPGTDGSRRTLVVDGEPMKHGILAWVRDWAFFNPPLSRYID